MNAFLSAATEIVHKAGLAAMKIPAHSRFPIYKDSGEIVTEGDRIVDNSVISPLKGLFPDHGFDSEERRSLNANSEYIWILDPIDGTKHYAKGLPFYSVSLALAQRGDLILGVVYAPELNRMYCAEVGSGSRVNGKTIQCSDEGDLEQTSICLEIPSRDSPCDELRWAMEKMSILAERVQRVRIIGVGSLGLCFCADGGFDAYVNLGSAWKRHDVAAGEVILREAGGEFLYGGETGRQIIAGSVGLCNRIRDILNI